MRFKDYELSRFYMNNPEAYVELMEERYGVGLTSAQKYFLMARLRLAIRSANGKPERVIFPEPVFKKRRK